MSFTSVSIDGLAITSCNVFNNTVRVAFQDDENSNPPALVFVRIKDLLVENFYFIDNDLGIKGLLAAKENADDIKITLSGCYAETSNISKWDESYVETIDCKFGEEEFETFPLRQLNLGSYQGEMSPGPMIITSFFTPSSSFSPSSEYTFSKQFSESAKFTNSQKFSNSDPFSKTKSFTHSDLFSKSDEFIESSKFTNSHLFSILR